MSIEEKKKPLEFTFIPDGMPNDNSEMEINIVYDETPLKEGGELFPIIISKNNKKILNCPVEFFTDVITFLVKKGIINSGYKQSIFNISQSTEKTNIPIPRIERKNRNEEKEINIPIDPLSSFDINSITEKSPVVSLDLKPIEQRKLNNSIQQIDSEKELKHKKNDVANQKEIPNRTVIRSRSKDGDPLSAEKEASMLRSAHSKSKKKIVRRSE